MKLYIIYDKETGEIVHKFRKVLAEKDESEDTIDCEPEEVMSSYRGALPLERLDVALISDYQPQTSRGRISRYDAAKSKITHKKTSEPLPSRRAVGLDVRKALGAGKE